MNEQYLITLSFRTNKPLNDVTAKALAEFMQEYINHCTGCRFATECLGSMRDEICKKN